MIKLASKAAITLIFTFVSSNAFAETVKLGEYHSDSGDLVTQYADLNTIRKNGNISKMWVITDWSNYQHLNNISILSGVFLHEYDCLNESSRRLTMVFYSGHMGSGDSVYNTHGPNNFEPVIPSSMDDASFKIACKSQ